MPNFGKLPQELASLQPFLQKADEIESREKVAAYYLRYYAVKLGIRPGSTSKECQIFLGKILDSLEQLKKELETSELLTNDTAAYAYLEGLALKIFLIADNEDRSGEVSKKTARTFYTASIFLESLTVFGDLEPDLAEKQKYARWKAADILHCLKEGIQPASRSPNIDPSLDPNTLDTPTDSLGGGGGFHLDTSRRAGPDTSSRKASHGSDFSEEKTPTFNTSSSRVSTDSEVSPRAPMSSLPPTIPSHFINFGRPPSILPTHTTSKSQESSLPSSSKPPPVKSSQPPLASSHSSDYTTFHKYDSKSIDQASKFCKYALSSLQYQDIAAAIDNLNKAMSLLASLEPP